MVKNRTITASLPESVIWKLDQLSQKWGASKSKLIMRGILLVAAEFDATLIPGKEPNYGLCQADVEREYYLREAGNNGETSEANS